MDEKRKIKLLIIEDNPSDYVLIRDNIMLEAPGRFDITIAERLSDGIKAGAGFDIAFIDLWLPDSSGLETLKKYIQAVPGVPVMVLTGMDNSEISVKAINSGAEDYLVKDYVDGKLLVRAIRYAIERNRIYRNLEKSRLDLLNLINNVPVMMFLVDREVKVRKVNSTALKYIKSEEQDVLDAPLGKALKCANCWENGLTCGESDKCSKCAIRLIVADSFETQTSFERVEINKTLMIGADPVNSYFYMSTMPLKYGDEDVILVSLEDTTIRRRFEENTQSALIRLKELDLMKSNFISMISHELRTPITSIKGFLSFLLAGAAGPNTEVQKEYLETIKNNSDRLHMLINDILDMSKMESGTFAVEKHSHDIIKVIDRAVKDGAILLEKNKIKMVKETGSIPLTVDIDDYRIIQVITNLLGNAVKFSLEGSSIFVGAKEVEYGSLHLPDYAEEPERASGKYVLVYVRDQGAGIEGQNITKIFDKFFQANGADSRVLKGVGLGLHISKNIVKSHSGTIWVESEGRGMGSSFNFILPA